MNEPTSTAQYDLSKVWEAHPDIRQKYLSKGMTLEQVDAMMQVKIAELYQDAHAGKLSPFHEKTEGRGYHALKNIPEAELPLSLVEGRLISKYSEKYKVPRNEVINRVRRVKSWDDKLLFGTGDKDKAARLEHKQEVLKNEQVVGFVKSTNRTNQIEEVYKSAAEVGKAVTNVAININNNLMESDHKSIANAAKVTEEALNFVQSRILKPLEENKTNMYFDPNNEDHLKTAAYRYEELPRWMRELNSPLISTITQSLPKETVDKMLNAPAGSKYDYDKILNNILEMDDNYRFGTGFIAGALNLSAQLPLFKVGGAIAKPVSKLMLGKMLPAISNKIPSSLANKTYKFNLGPYGGYIPQETPTFGKVIDRTVKLLTSMTTNAITMSPTGILDGAEFSFSGNVRKDNMAFWGGIANGILNSGKEGAIFGSVQTLPGFGTRVIAKTLYDINENPDFYNHNGRLDRAALGHNMAMNLLMLNGRATGFGKELIFPAGVNRNSEELFETLQNRYDVLSHMMAEASSDKLATTKQHKTKVGVGIENLQNERAKEYEKKRQIEQGILSPQWFYGQVVKSVRDNLIEQHKNASQELLEASETGDAATKKSKSYNKTKIDYKIKLIDQIEKEHNESLAGKVGLDNSVTYLGGIAEKINARLLKETDKVKKATLKAQLASTHELLKDMKSRHRIAKKDVLGVENDWIEIRDRIAKLNRGVGIMRNRQKQIDDIIDKLKNNKDPKAIPDEFKPEIDDFKKKALEFTESRLAQLSDVIGAIKGARIAKMLIGDEKANTTEIDHEAYAHTETMAREYNKIRQDVEYAKDINDAMEIVMRGENLIKTKSKAPAGAKSEPVDPLIQEALKYKTEDEFITKQGTPLYHGTNKNFEKFDRDYLGTSSGNGSGTESGWWFTPDIEIAKYWGNEAQSSIGRVGTPPIIKNLFIDPKNLLIVDAFKDNDFSIEKYVKIANDNDNDAIRFDNIRDAGEFSKPSISYLVLNDNIIKTESQLRDTYRKAHEAKPKSEPSSGFKYDYNEALGVIEITTPIGTIKTPIKLTDSKDLERFKKITTVAQDIFSDHMYKHYRTMGLTTLKERNALFAGLSEMIDVTSQRLIKSVGVERADMLLGGIQAYPRIAASMLKELSRQGDVLLNKHGLIFTAKDLNPNVSKMVESYIGKYNNRRAFAEWGSRLVADEQGILNVDKGIGGLDRYAPKEIEIVDGKIPPQFTVGQTSTLKDATTGKSFKIMYGEGMVSEDGKTAIIPRFTVIEGDVLKAEWDKLPKNLQDALREYIDVKSASYRWIHEAKTSINRELMRNTFDVQGNETRIYKSSDGKEYAFGYIPTIRLNQSLQPGRMKNAMHNWAFKFGKASGARPPDAFEQPEYIAPPGEKKAIRTSSRRLSRSGMVEKEEQELDIRSIMQGTAKSFTDEFSQRNILETIMSFSVSQAPKELVNGKWVFSKLQPDQVRLSEVLKADLPTAEEALLGLFKGGSIDAIIFRLNGMSTQEGRYAIENAKNPEAKIKGMISEAFQNAVIPRSVCHYAYGRHKPIKLNTSSTLINNLVDGLDQIMRTGAAGLLAKPASGYRNLAGQIEIYTYGMIDNMFKDNYLYLVSQDPSGIDSAYEMAENLLSYNTPLHLLSKRLFGNRLAFPSPVRDKDMAKLVEPTSDALKELSRLYTYLPIKVPDMIFKELAATFSANRRAKQDVLMYAHKEGITDIETIKQLAESMTFEYLRGDNVGMLGGLISREIDRLAFDYTDAPYWLDKLKQLPFGSVGIVAFPSFQVKALQWMWNHSFGAAMQIAGEAYKAAHHEAYDANLLAQAMGMLTTGGLAMSQALALYKDSEEYLYGPVANTPNTKLFNQVREDIEKDAVTNKGMYLAGKVPVHWRGENYLLDLTSYSPILGKYLAGFTMLDGRASKDIVSEMIFSMGPGAVLAKSMADVWSGYDGKNHTAWTFGETAGTWQPANYLIELYNDFVSPLAGHKFERYMDDYDGKQFTKALDGFLYKMPPQMYNAIHGESQPIKTMNYEPLFKPLNERIAKHFGVVMQQYDPMVDDFIMEKYLDEDMEGKMIAEVEKEFYDKKLDGIYAAVSENPAEYNRPLSPSQLKSLDKKLYNERLKKVDEVEFGYRFYTFKAIFQKYMKMEDRLDNLNKLFDKDATYYHKIWTGNYPGSEPVRIKDMIIVQAMRDYERKLKQISELFTHLNEYYKNNTQGENDE